MPGWLVALLWWAHDQLAAALDARPGSTWFFGVGCPLITTLVLAAYDGRLW